MLISAAYTIKQVLLVIKKQAILINDCLRTGIDMADIHISDFMEGRTQSEVAQIIGVTQVAVQQMLASKRDVYLRFTESADGVSVYETAYEIKPIKGRKKAA